MSALSAITPLSAPGVTTPPASNTSNNGVDQLANEQTFLQLLVAQIQNQDPSTPADPAQFVGELTQFSQLEQLIGIRQEIQTQTQAQQAQAQAQTQGQQAPSLFPGGNPQNPASSSSTQPAALS